TSSVDVTPLLLSIATGSAHWRGDARFQHLAQRHDLAGICEDPAAPGRPWILHATDEDVTEFAKEPYAAEAPRHVVALRTPHAKLGIYSNWRPGSIAPEASGQEAELYDYSVPSGRAEIENVAGSSALEEELYATLEQAIPGELRTQLPLALRAAHARGLADHQSVEEYENKRMQKSHLQELGHEGEETPALPG
ncbi:MAG TPA: hypothetical protein VGF15_07745, partial [Solirubrobacteraceae bacterium]